MIVGLLTALILSLNTNVGQAPLELVVRTHPPNGRVCIVITDTTVVGGDVGIIHQSCWDQTDRSHPFGLRRYVLSEGTYKVELTVGNDVLSSQTVIVTEPNPSNDVVVGR